MSNINTIEELEAIYGTPSRASTIKVTQKITADYAAFIEASPFLALATSGPEGLDCSPRGDRPGFVRVVNETTLQLPDRHGNNRIDSLRNIVRDPRIAMLFFVPGNLMTLRVNGQAKITTEQAICRAFEVAGKPPRSVLNIHVDEAFFQCGRAIMRADLWSEASHAAPSRVPTPGQILANLSNQEVGGAAYDREWPDRAEKTLW